MRDSKHADIQQISEYRKPLMGIAIILIILFHYGAIYNYYDVNSNVLSVITGKVLGAIGVDIFAFLSGIGVFFSLNKNSTVQYCKNRIQRIIPVYIIIGGLFWIIKDLLLLNEKLGVFFKDLSLVSFWTQGENRFWYIAFICSMYLIAPFIYIGYKHNKHYFEGLCIFLSAVTVVLIICLYIMTPSFYYNTEIALKRIPVFIIGLLFGSWIFDSQIVTTFALVVMSILGIALYLFAKLTSYDLFDRFDLSVISIVFCAVIPSALSKIKKSLLFSILDKAGELSLELYLSHVALIWLCIYFKIWLPNCNIYIVMIAVSIVISVCVQHVVKIIS